MNEPSFNIAANETPEQRSIREKRRAAVANALMTPGQVPQNVGEGIASLGSAMLYRQQQQNNAFPVAPGGAKPSFMSAMKNMFGGGGGMY